MADSFTPATGPQPPLNFGPAPVGPDFDPLGVLPIGTPQDRMRMLRQHSLDARALVPEFEIVRQASLSKVEAANALKRLVEHPQEFGAGLPPDAPQVVAAQRLLDQRTADFDRVQQRQAERAASWQSAARVVSEVESYLRHGVPGGCALEAVEVEPPKPNKGESLLDHLDRVRRRCRELRADLHRTRSASYPLAHVKRKLREIVERIAREPDLTNLIEHDTDIVWPSTRYQADVIGGAERALAFHESFNGLGVLAWLMKDQLLKKLFELADESGDDQAALSHEARQTAEAQLLGDILAQERIESEIVWLLMAQGGNVEHRADCAPQAILGVQLKTNKLNGAPPTSSPLVWDVVQPGGGRR